MKQDQKQKEKENISQEPTLMTARTSEKTAQHCVDNMVVA